jgi:hypothetical protein
MPRYTVRRTKPVLVAVSVEAEHPDLALWDAVTSIFVYDARDLAAYEVTESGDVRV